MKILDKNVLVDYLISKQKCLAAGGHISTFQVFFFKCSIRSEKKVRITSFHFSLLERITSLLSVLEKQEIW